MGGTQRQREAVRERSELCKPPIPFLLYALKPKFRLCECESTTTLSHVLMCFLCQSPEQSSCYAASG